MRAVVSAMMLSSVLFISIASASGIDECKEAFSKGDYVTAFGECKGQADRGDAKAELRVGYMYNTGKGIERDAQEAVRWYTRAAMQGNAEAEYGLGNIYLFGQGVAKDYITSYLWFYLAAGQGHASAGEHLKGLEHRMTKEQIAEAKRRLEKFNSSPEK